MPKRIAITIAGAVSLGSYEAGVLYELLEAIRTNNVAASSEDHKIYIDVLTGASAGGMTAAMVSQRLMYDAGALQGATSNVLYQAWVERISLMGLVRLRWKERRWNSLFSSDLIEAIGESMLVTSMKDLGSRPHGPHAAVEKVDGIPQTLRVGLALTNLNGIDYMIPIVGIKEGGFNYTTSLDQKLFDIAANGATDDATWRQLCAAAVGSGAFPVAFRPQAIEHHVAEYGEPLPTNPAQRKEGKTYVDWPAQKLSAYFAHSDGGILQNQPLGIAKNLVDLAVAEREQRAGDNAHCDNVDRLYAFISPNSVKSSARALTAGSITIWDELKQLFHVYTRQAAFHDWITAEQMNQRIRLLDERACELSKAIVSGKINADMEINSQNKIDLDALDKASTNLNNLLIPDLPKRLARLRKQYSEEYRAVENAEGSLAAETFISAIATLEAAAHLENREKMRIFAVIPDPQKLAGAGFAAFVGFFRKSYRQHDYWVGRVKAREYLQRPDVKQILGVSVWPQEQDWKTPLPNPTRVKLPLNKFELFAFAIIPSVIMVALRPILLLFLVLGISLSYGLVLELCKLLHR